MLAVWGERELYRRTVKPARDQKAGLENIARLIEDVESEFRAGNYPAKRAGQMIASLEAEQERLAALPSEPAREEWEPAGITVRQHWASLNNDADRGHLLKTWGVRVMAWRDQGGELHVILSHGQPDGFEQATGLLLPHDEEEHQALFEVAGVLVRRADDGAYEQMKEPMDTAVTGAIRDRLDSSSPLAPLAEARGVNRGLSAFGSIHTPIPPPGGDVRQWRNSLTWWKPVLHRRCTSLTPFTGNVTSFLPSRGWLRPTR